MPHYKLNSLKSPVGLTQFFIDVCETLELFRDEKIDESLHLSVAFVLYCAEEIRAMAGSIVVFYAVVGDILQKSTDTVFSIASKGGII